MLFPRKMRFIEITVLKNDMDAVIEYIGRKTQIQFSDEDKNPAGQQAVSIKTLVERLKKANEYLLGESTNDLYRQINDDTALPSQEQKTEAQKLCLLCEELKEREDNVLQKKKRILKSINELKIFTEMNVPFSDFENLSHLTLRAGRIDMSELDKLRESLGQRAVIIHLEDNRILAVASKKGRFSLDAKLEQFSFESEKLPQVDGPVSDFIKDLHKQEELINKELDKIRIEKDNLVKNNAADFCSLFSAWRIALVIEEIKQRFKATESLFLFSGWIPADILKRTVKDLSDLTGGRIAINSYKPYEVPSVKSGLEKVPVAMRHSAFVKGFEGVVFSYGAPVYGSVDPTALVAIFFTLMFGIMFGDVGQGALLLAAGLLIKFKIIKRFQKFAVPLISVSIASMIMGFLSGSVFANESLLIAPSRAITAFFTGEERDRILTILPMASHGGSVTKLLYFFAFTVSIGVVINSLGLIINIVNRILFKKYEQAFFSKTGLAGLLMFWYALFIAVRLIRGGNLYSFDFLGICIPLFFIIFGHVIWHIITGSKFRMESGLFAFVMEGFVEILDTVSSYVSNTASFLRVGAFALAHAVFSFIIFFFTESLSGSGAKGALSAALIMIIGNAIIIVLEGLIVAIQVMRLQYYEFFNKFFVETGVEFAPFRFQHKK